MIPAGTAIINIGVPQKLASAASNASPIKPPVSGLAIAALILSLFGAGLGSILGRLVLSLLGRHNEG